MWIPLAVGLMFLVVNTVNAVDGEAEISHVVTGYAVGFWCLAIWWSLRLSHQKRVSFLRWLVENQDRVRKGGADYEGRTISEATETTQYRVAVSFVVVSSLHSSRYYLDEEATWSRAAWFSLCSLLAGLWGLPWGPIFTVGSVASNLRGGRKRSVADLLGDMTGHQKLVVHLTERAAAHATRVMAERGFPTGSAMRLEVERKGREEAYVIQYDDLPTSDGHDWLGNSHGMPVLVAKRLAPRVQGMTIDVDDGRYVFKTPSKPSVSDPAHAVWDRDLDA